jgi:hypothetical protein
MSLLFGKGYLINSAAYTLSPTVAQGITGYVTPIVPAPEIVDNEDEFKMLKDQLGIVEGIVTPNDCILKCTFNFLPRGVSQAAAANSASLPNIGGYGVVGLPIVAVRKFSDGFNTGGGNTQPWFYFGGGTLTGAEDGKEWRGSITLHRFFYITSSTPIT